MFSLKVVFLCAIVASVVAEPPRRQRNFRPFARQESADNPPASEGYNYEAPAERLRLPIRFTQFARQQEASSGGYSYPKPTESYGPPEEATEPTTEDTTDDTTDADAAVTDNPQAESFRSLPFTQSKRKNAKFSRIQQSQKLTAQLVQEVPTVAFQQPIFYVQYPTEELVQPQYVYVFK